MTPWHRPLPVDLVVSEDENSFIYMNEAETALPIGNHPGAFGVKRSHHTHEGVDLYAPPGTPVLAVEGGVLVKTEAFTGPGAGSPWWNDTEAAFVEGETGVVVYGELRVAPGMEIGKVITAGEVIGYLTPVLKKDKGRPGCMLHLELHRHGTREAPGWNHGDPRPLTLLDPTPYLFAISAVQKPERL